jgi:hypothetical protein
MFSKVTIAPERRGAQVSSDPELTARVLNHACPVVHTDYWYTPDNISLALLPTAASWLAPKWILLYGALGHGPGARRGAVAVTVEPTQPGTAAPQMRCQVSHRSDTSTQADESAPDIAVFAPSLFASKTWRRAARGPELRAPVRASTHRMWSGC